MSGYPTPEQIRGARGMLDWSRLDLARAAGCSISTIKRVEALGSQFVSEEVFKDVQAALEGVGLRFLDDAGEGAGLHLLARWRSRSPRPGTPPRAPRDRGDVTASTLQEEAASLAGSASSPGRKHP